MEARLLISSFLSCGSLDADFMINVFNTYDISLPEILDEIESIYWNSKPSFNQIITHAFERIATEFIDNAVKHRASHFRTTNFNIFANYLDSHIWFEDENLNRWFEAWRRL